MQVSYFNANLQFQRKGQPKSPEISPKPFLLNLYEEARSSPSSDVSDSSENEGEPDISCSHSEISDVNEQDGEEDIFGLLYRQNDEEILNSSKALNQTTGKVRSPVEDQDESNSQSNSEEADDQSIFPEFWLGFNSYEQEPTDKDPSKTESDDRNDSCQEKDSSSLLEPNIVFYQQANVGNVANLGRVLDDLTPTEESGSSLRTIPFATFSKVDSTSSKEDVLVKPPKVVSEVAKIFKSPKQRTLLGKRNRSNIEDEINSLFEDSIELKRKPMSSLCFESKLDLTNRDVTSHQKVSCEQQMNFSFIPKRRLTKMQDKEEEI